MFTDPTTRKLAAQLIHAALDVDRLTRQLAAREDLTSAQVSGSIAILHHAVDELTSALYTAEEVFDLRIRAEYPETARILAPPAPAGAA